MLHPTIQQCPPPSPLSIASKFSPKIHPKIAFPNCFFLLLKIVFLRNNITIAFLESNSIKKMDKCMSEFFLLKSFPEFFLLNFVSKRNFPQIFPSEIRNFSIIFLKSFLRPHSSQCNDLLFSCGIIITLLFEGGGLFEGRGLFDGGGLFFEF